MQQKNHIISCKQHLTIIFLALCLYFTLTFSPQVAFALDTFDTIHPEQAGDFDNTYVINNLDDLNEALGGVHLIESDRLILQSNVTLEHGLYIENFSNDNCIIDMNGYNIEISFRGYAFVLGRTADNGTGKLQFIGDGSITSETACFFRDECFQYQLILSGNIKYRSINPFFDQVKSLIIKNGDFKINNEDNDYIQIGGMEGEFGSAKISGGNFRNKVIFETESCKISGGLFQKDVISRGISCTISGGTIKGACKIYSQCTIKGNAELNNSLYIYCDNVTISGGSISGKKQGIYIDTDYTLESEDSEIYWDTFVKITGGTIESRTSNGYGIYCESVPCPLYIRNCKIKSKNDNGKAGIYLKEVCPLRLKADEGKKSTIKGYRYGIVDKLGGNVKIDKRAILKMSLTKKKYTCQDTLGKYLEGNITISRK